MESYYLEWLGPSSKILDNNPLNVYWLGVDGTMNKIKKIILKNYLRELKNLSYLIIKK